MTASLKRHYEETSTTRPLRDRTAAEYAQWLLDGLRGYLHEGEGRDAFPEEESVHVIDGHMRDMTLEGELAQIFRKLPFESWPPFRNGCVEALRSLDFNDEKDARIAKSIMRLCSHIDAYQVVDMLAERQMGEPDDRNKSDLHYLAYELKRDLRFF